MYRGQCATIESKIVDKPLKNDIAVCLPENKVINTIIKNYLYYFCFLQAFYYFVQAPGKKIFMATFDPIESLGLLIP